MRTKHEGVHQAAQRPVVSVVIPVKDDSAMLERCLAAMLRAPLAALYLFTYTVTTTPALGHRPLFGSNLAMRREVWESVRTSVHRDDPELHDDLDLSFHIGERHRVRYVKTEAMGMSMRPFRSASSFRRRTYRGFRTVAVHWPRDFPPHRWSRMFVLGYQSLAASMRANR